MNTLQMKISRIYILVLLLFLFIPSFAVAQKSRSVNVEANKSWTKFFAEFSTAVKKRDRPALKAMISDSFDWTAERLGVTPDGVVKILDEEKVWKILQKSLAVRRFIPTKYDSRPARQTKTDYPTCFFVFEADGKWRWQAVLGD